MNNWMQDYIEQHALGDSRYGWTTVKSLYNDKEIKVRIFDAPPPEEQEEWGKENLLTYYFGGQRIWVETGRVSRGELAEWYGITTYDYAVPQEWFNEYMRRHGRPPEAVWAYNWVDRAGEACRNFFGEPVFISDMLAALAADAYRQILQTRQIARKEQA